MGMGVGEKKKTRQTSSVETAEISANGRVVNNSTRLVPSSLQESASSQIGKTSDAVLPKASPTSPKTAADAEYYTTLLYFM